MNKIAQDILENAISALSRDALEQIAHHCETSVALAKKYGSDTQSEQIAFVRSPAPDELEQLAVRCRRILAMK